MNEEWRPIAGFEGYEVSNLGRVRCWRPLFGRPVAVPSPRLLKLTPSSTGYLSFSLPVKGGRRTGFVHRAVLEAFVGAAPAGHQACHSNGVRTDNQLENLRWGTATENAADRDAHGKTRRGDTHPQRLSADLVLKGSRHGRAKLTDADVAAILATPPAPRYQTALAERYGVSLTQINAIVRRRAWRHVEAS